MTSSGEINFFAAGELQRDCKLSQNCRKGEQTFPDPLQWILFVAHAGLEFWFFLPFREK
jgi:hypothetical protein